MVKLPRLTCQEAEELLIQAGFTLIRIKGSHRIYRIENVRIIIPCHTGRILHPKIVKQLYKCLEMQKKF